MKSPPQTRLRETQQLARQSVEGFSVKDLGKQVCQVSFGVDMLWNDDVLVTKHSNPVLSHIDVLKFRLESTVVDKAFSSGVVHLQDHRLWKVNVAHLVNNVRQV